MAPVKGGLGAFGETWAAAYLTRRGYRIVERNARFRSGEIDIVAYDGAELVFVEVKCRRSRRFGSPEESVTRARYERLAAAIQEYLADRRLAPDAYRVDVVGIEVAKDGRVSRCSLVKGAEAPRE